MRTDSDENTFFRLDTYFCSVNQNSEF